MNQEEITDSLRKVAALYDTPLPSTRSGALFNAFSYPTKISPEVIALFIATHTEPGAHVLDAFAGSGTTGLAALLCDSPTPGMKRAAESLALNPVWGPRTAVLYEVGVLGSFIAKTMCSPPDADRFRIAATKLLNSANRKLGWMWSAKNADGIDGQVRHNIWSDVLVCKNCGFEKSYWDAAVRFDPLQLAPESKCPRCSHVYQVSHCPRATERYFDRLLGREAERKKRVLVRVCGRNGSQTWQRPPSDVDFDTIRRVEEYSIDCAPIVEIEWGDLFRTGYHRGITHLHHFYTHRNFLALTCVWNMVDECEEDLRDALRLLILSYNASHSTLMTRIVVKKGQKDFVITGAQSGVLYISSLPVEKNVFEGLRRKVITLCDAFHLISDSASQVQVVNASSAVLQSPDASIDYVFTDPPFGDYIPYAEINQLNEAWLGKKTDYKQEIVVSVTRGKSLSDYQSMMGQVFSEIARVVKDGAMATLVFHSAKSEVWRAMVESYSGAGFVVERTSVLDKLQSSFKQVVSEVFVKGDALLLLRKQAHSSYHATDSVDLAFHDVLERAATAKDAREREMARLYSRYVTRCLELRLHVHMSADEFYRKAKMTLEIQ